MGYRKSEPQSTLTRETSQVLGKVFAALRAEGTPLAEVARDLDLRAADLSDLIFGLVVMGQEGGRGSARSAATSRRPQLSVVR